MNKRGKEMVVDDSDSLQDGAGQGGENASHANRDLTVDSNFETPSSSEEEEEIRGGRDGYAASM